MCIHPSMIIDKILAMFTPEVRNSDAMRVLVALHQTFSEQFQQAQAQLQITQLSYNPLKNNSQKLWKKSNS